MTQDLVRSLFAAEFDNSILDRMDDSATFELEGRLAFTTDCHVVSPYFFPGGDIGRLALTGTVNDLAMTGAFPLYVAAGFIIEEGFPRESLGRIARSMQEAAAEARVQVVAGDTKVVERGAADGIFITTSGLGLVPPGVNITGSAASPGDVVILSGTVGDHGVAVMSRREGMRFETAIESDCAPLGELVRRMLSASDRVRVLRDPTRGGLAAALNEIAASSGVAIEIDEASLPLKPEVGAACEVLGLDPLTLANEGKLVAMVDPEDAGRVLAAMKTSPMGAAAAVIGTVERADRPRVYVRTAAGSRRALMMPSGEQLPRIC